MSDAAQVIAWAMNGQRAPIVDAPVPQPSPQQQRTTVMPPDDTPYYAALGRNAALVLAGLLLVYVAVVLIRARRRYRGVHLHPVPLDYKKQKRLMQNFAQKK